MYCLRQKYLGICIEVVYTLYVLVHCENDMALNASMDVWEDNNNSYIEMPILLYFSLFTNVLSLSQRIISALCV